MQTLKIGTLVELVKEKHYSARKRRGIGVVVQHRHYSVYHVYWPLKGRVILTNAVGLREVTNESR